MNKVRAKMIPESQIKFNRQTIRTRGFTRGHTGQGKISFIEGNMTLANLHFVRCNKLRDTVKKFILNNEINVRSGEQRRVKPGLRITNIANPGNKRPIWISHSRYPILRTTFLSLSSAH